MRQQDFAAALLDPALPVPPGLCDPQGRPAGKRFAVYRNNLAASLTEALEIGFPVLRKLMGEGPFRTLALLYARRHPPRGRQLAHYGQQMPDFLAGIAQLAGYPYLPDIARLELALRRSYHAADHAPLDASALAPEELMELSPRLAPSAEILSSAHPIHGLWQRNTTPDAPRPRPGPEAVLVARAGFDPAVHLLSPGALAFARALDGKTTIALALERAVEAAPGLDLSALLTLFLTSGALTRPHQGATP